MARAAVINKPKSIDDQTRVLRDQRARLLRRQWAECNHDGSAIHAR